MSDNIREKIAREVADELQLEWGTPGTNDYCFNFADRIIAVFRSASPPA